MIFYTADLHFHYEPFLPSRPFDTVEDMDRQLIHRWNEAVSEEDTVYVVGDVGYNRGLVPGDALSRLRGHKHLIRGNHDTGFENAGEMYRYFETVTDFNEIDDGEVQHYPLPLSHSVPQAGLYGPRPPAPGPGPGVRHAAPNAPGAQRRGGREFLPPRDPSPAH